MRIVIPYPPSLNRYYRFVTKLRRVLISEEGRRYRQAVAAALKAQRLPLELDTSGKIIGLVALTVDVYPPDRRKRDLDNVLKALLDSLTKAEFWEDDSQVAELHVFRREPVQGGSISLEVIRCKDAEKLPARKALRYPDANRGSGDTRPKP